MLRREVVESQQLITVLDQTFGCLGVFRFEGFNEQIEGVLSQIFLRLRCSILWTQLSSERSKLLEC